MKKFLFFFAILPVLLMGCSNPSKTPPSSNTSSTGISQTALPAKGDEVAVISTEFGDITIRLFPEVTPKTVENFVTHAKNGYYDGVIFHRVIDGFMIQGGDPKGNGTGGESIWGGKFDDELSPDLRNIRGAIAMANAGQNTNGSQFFIDQVDSLYLDGYDSNGTLKDCANPRVSCHAVFGQVIDGMDVVDTIAKVQIGPGSKPLEDIKMTVKVVEYEG